VLVGFAENGVEGKLLSKYEMARKIKMAILDGEKMGPSSTDAVKV